MEDKVKLMQAAPKLKEGGLCDLFKTSGNTLHFASHLPLAIC
jgi:hypothetical protein